MSFPSLSPVLVIGGCGGLGHHLVQLLVEDSSSSDIAVLDINTKTIELMVSNISRAEVKPRVIFHTASPKLMVQANTRQLYTEVNVNGTTLLLECIRAIGVTKALIYTSSSSVIHNNMTDLVNATEDVPLCFEPEQTEYYTHTKAVAEQIILSANKQNQLLTTIIRAAMLFGEGDATSTPQLVGNARAGRGKFQIGNGTNLFDFTYIGNTAYAHVLAAKALLRESAATEPVPEDSKVNGEAFVITNDDPWPFWDYTRAIGAAAGHTVKKEDIWVVSATAYYYFVIILEWAAWVFSFGRKESVVNRRMVKYLTMTRTFDISKAKKRLGYRPQVSMQEGIQRTVDFYVARHPEGR
ncbi:3beta-hydroxysteroid-dehydrogenase/decarboxylase isoform [Lachnellula hyalina]|uniref:3beta-hydroxysteroid-dehydrogenase/decarboxylase isoform n=1 Tax=Lachnellula hyalina TaxID=1316788 RepID=A0A8H8TW51_9HELO|nr:3beta-hydroxysteroid-dehydrogenase/decarboxylase isoform [Lachnellula hyalina]TVY24042.1 3beta-hydroxysteroid-dehydrogenase/decarboxylase isoform [Lachnellula hyalina]